MKKPVIVIAIMFNFLILGCKGNTVPAGPVLSGNIQGSVNLVEQNNTNDFSGVIISINSDTFTDSTISLSDGTWKLTNIPAGIYSFTFSKPGFFTRMEYNFQFVGDGTFYFPKERLEYVSSSAVAGLSIIHLDSIKSIHIEGSITPNDPNSRYVYLFLSENQFPNSIPIKSSRIIYIATNGEPNFSMNYSDDYLLDSFKNGVVIYAVAVLGGFGDAGINLNPSTDMYEFNTQGVSRSNVVQFVIP